MSDGVNCATHELTLPEGTVVATRCGACQRVHVPARWHRCLGCGSKRLSATRVALAGVFESWTVLNVHESDVGGWALGLVRLDAGPMLTARVRITGVALYVGARVVGACEHGSGVSERFWFEVVPAADAEAAKGVLREVAA